MDEYNGLFYVGTDTEREQLPEQMTLSDKNKGKSLEIKWTKSPSPGTPSEEYQLKTTDDIKTAIINAFSASPNANTMINDAKKLAKEEYVIVDLRHNQGGLGLDATMCCFVYKSYLFNLTDV